MSLPFVSTAPWRSRRPQALATVQLVGNQVSTAGDHVFLRNGTDTQCSTRVSRAHAWCYLAGSRLGVVGDRTAGQGRDGRTDDVLDMPGLDLGTDDLAGELRHSAGPSRQTNQRELSRTVIPPA